MAGVIVFLHALMDELLAGGAIAGDRGPGYT